MTHGMGQIVHGTVHITVHLKMRLSELICLLPHCDLLMLHLRTLTFWRRNNNDRLTLSWQTCPHTRPHPDASLARVFTFRPPGMTPIAQSIWLMYTHKTYAKYQHGDKVPQTDVPASTSSSSRRQHFLHCSSASLHSFSAAALHLAASAS